MAFATHTDLETRWHGLAEADQARADVLLGDVSMWFKVWFREFGDLETLVVSDELLAEALKVMACSVVKRAMATGDFEGASGVEQAMGPITMNVTYRNPEGNLYLTKSEFDTIAVLLGRNPSGAVSMTAVGL
jgi:hypothetical protein